MPVSRLYSTMNAVKIGIVGYGKLGQFLVDQLIADGEKYDLKLVFVWNRSELDSEHVQKLMDNSINLLDNVSRVADPDNEVDLIVEVCHPTIVHQYGLFFLDHSNLMVSTPIELIVNIGMICLEQIGTPTSLADQEFYDKLTNKIAESKFRVLVARGALWGANDIQLMAQRNQLQSVKITMSFHPRSLRLTDSYLAQLNDELGESENGAKARILFEGPARELCPIAPNNVNTIATAALIGVGFDQTIGCLITDSSLCDYHRITYEVRGKPGIDDKQFEINCERKSPTTSAQHVTSLQTFESFWQSILECTGSLRNQKSIRIC